MLKQREARLTDFFCVCTKHDMNLRLPDPLNGFFWSDFFAPIYIIMFKLLNYTSLKKKETKKL